MVISYSIENDALFKASLDDAFSKIDNLKLPFKLISMDFYKSQQAIFMLQSPGQYPDFGGLKPTARSTEKAKQAKYKKVGFVYPLLVGKTKRLKDSTTSPNHSDSINIIGEKVLVIGTRTPYGVYHQSDSPRKKMPLRKFLFIGPEASRYATSEQMGRLERWVKIIKDYVDSKLKQLETAT